MRLELDHALIVFKFYIPISIQLTSNQQSFTVVSYTSFFTGPSPNGARLSSVFQESLHHEAPGDVFGLVHCGYALLCKLLFVRSVCLAAYLLPVKTFLLISLNKVLCPLSKCTTLRVCQVYAIYGQIREDLTKTDLLILQQRKIEQHFLQCWWFQQS